MYTCSSLRVWWSHWQTQSSSSRTKQQISLLIEKGRQWISKFKTHELLLQSWLVDFDLEDGSTVSSSSVSVSHSETLPQRFREKPYLFCHCQGANTILFFFYNIQAQKKITGSRFHKKLQTGAQQHKVTKSNLYTRYFWNQHIHCKLFTQCKL